jgi:hypothetical protein
MDVRARRHGRAAWLVALPIAAASWLSAHCLGYLLVPPAKPDTMHHHMDESHNWFASMPVLVAAGVTVLAAGLVLCVGEGWGGRQGSSPAPSRVFALLPAVGFVVQEHLEHFLASGSAPYEVALEPTFLTGLALQLPFALGALLLAGRLSALGYRFGRLLARAIPAAPVVDRQPIPVVSLMRPARVAASSVLAPAHAPRAPPCAAPS